MSRKAHLIVAGGGTGGHFFCGYAFAEAFLEKYPTGEVTFVGVQSGIEGRVPLSDSRMKKFFVSARGLLGKSRLDKFFALFSLCLGLFQCLLFLFRSRPALVLGVGGYASVPMVAAAWLSRPLLRHRVRVVDQNSVAGASNRLFSRLGVPAFSGFPSLGFRSIDLPVRKSFLPSERKLGAWPPKKILILGGSQGAQGLNQAWLRVLPNLKKKLPGLQVRHQSGKAFLEICRSSYEQLQIEAECFAFRENLREDYEWADLIVARSGALSIFEIIAHQKPCIFVPFPHATHQHQWKNAIAVQDARWVLQESEFGWAALEALLDASKPSIPRSPDGPRQNWQQLIQL